MSTTSIRLPESLHDAIREVARKEGISIGLFIASAACEKLAIRATEEHLAARARRGDRSEFEAALCRVPVRAPDPDDAI
jgi:predicted DNA-binding ribbon-helix-helix protein